MTPSPEQDWRSDPSLWFRPSELPARSPRVPRGVHGNGRLANREDLAELLALPRPGDLFLPDVSPLVESAADGGTLSPLLHHGLTLPAEVRERHVLAVGGTGAGKTQRLILPQLAADVADPGRTIIALDAKGGVLFGYLTALVRRYRPGQRVQLINLRSASRNTLTWNPAHRISSRAEALEIAHAVCSNAETGSGSGHSTNEAFWLFSSVNLLADLLRVLADNPREHSSLARAKELIDKDAMGLAVLADEHPHSKDFAKHYPAVVRLLEGGSNVTQQSIVADLAMRTLLFGDEDIIRTTSGPNQLDIRQTLREGGILVLEVPEGHAKQLLPLTNLFISRLFSALLAESMDTADGRLSRPCSVVLDELGSACGKLPDFDVRLSTLRSRGVSVTGAVQTLGQLEHLYGTGSRGVLDGFSTKLFHGGGLGQTDAKYASDLAGTCTVANVSVTKARDPVHGMRTSRTMQPTARLVLLPEEVSRPAAHSLLGSPVTVFTPGRPPFWAYFPPAFEQPATANSLREGVEIEAELRERADASDDEAELTECRRLLGWERLSGPAVAWWHRLERHEGAKLLALLRGLAEEAGRLAAMPKKVKHDLLDELFQASKECKSADAEVLLAFLHYRLLEQAAGRAAPDEKSPG